MTLRTLSFAAALAVALVMSGGTPARVATAGTAAGGEAVDGARAFVSCIVARQVGSQYREDAVITLIACAPRLLDAEPY